MATGADALERFRDAQNGGVFDVALREIRSGAKRSHWIWFVFPQVAGLGSSGMSDRFGIRSADEAAQFLRDPVLGRRLATISTAVAEQVKDGTTLRRLMGADVDVLKLVSSMTLFEEIVNRLGTAASAEHRELLDAARTILDAARSEGFSRCAFTLGQLADQ